MVVMMVALWGKHLVVMKAPMMGVIEVVTKVC
jgi:hypothetical protein